MVQDDIGLALEAALAAEGAAGTSFVLEYPPKETEGDLACNAAFAAAKALKISPKEAAQRLVAYLTVHPVPGVANISIAGPGFINFFLTREIFAQTVAQARDAKGWGRNETFSGEKILIEYTSPNLFKPLHIGNLVGNIIGESLARLLTHCGATIVRLNYPSDIGLTVAKGVWGLRKNNADPEHIAALGEAYRLGSEAYESDAEAKAQIDEINKKLYEGSDPELNQLRAAGAKTSRAHLDAICRTLGTVFDEEFFESAAAPVGLALVRAHVADGIFEQSEGAVVFRGEKEGLHTRVFINSAGLPTYEAKDLGNFALKREHYPDWTQSFIVTGGEQREYFRVIFAALRHLFPEDAQKKNEHIPTGFLSLTTGKMSSRKGNVITGESLIESMQAVSREKMGERELGNKEEVAQQVGVAAIKYTVLKQASGKNIVFDPEKSLSLEGDSGPYLQYAHARARSILRKANEEHAAADAAVPTDEAPLVERLLVRFPGVVRRAAREYEPHYLAQYLTELAGEFNHWYGEVRVLDGTPAAAYKLALVEAVAQTLKVGLELLGMEAPEEM